MAWDSSRPVPWRRLIREWLLYVGVATVAFIVYFQLTDRKFDVTLFAGLLSSGPLYLLFGSVMAKMGYQRKTLKDLRSEREVATSSSQAASSSSAAGARNKPAPTKRTSTGPSQHRKSTKPKRR